LSSNGQRNTAAILVVDRSQLLLSQAQQVLRSAGYVVTTLRDPARIIATMFEHRPDIVLCGIEMPVIIEGHPLIERGRHAFRLGQMTVLLHSSIPKPSLDPYVRPLRADGCVTKSMQCIDLVAQLKAHRGACESVQRT